jgi:hypothetical protein
MRAIDIKIRSSSIGKAPYADVIIHGEQLLYSKAASSRTIGIELSGGVAVRSIDLVLRRS